MNLVVIPACTTQRKLDGCVPNLVVEGCLGDRVAFLLQLEAKFAAGTKNTYTMNRKTGSSVLHVSF